MSDIHSLRMGHFWNEFQFSQEIDKTNRMTYSVVRPRPYPQVKGLLKAYLSEANEIQDVDIISVENVRK